MMWTEGRVRRPRGTLAASPAGRASDAGGADRALRDLRALDEDVRRYHAGALKSIVHGGQLQARSRGRRMTLPEDVRRGRFSSPARPRVAHGTAAV
jgi:hypothetical protein